MLSGKSGLIIASATLFFVDGLSLSRVMLGFVSLNPTFYEGCQVLFFIFFELAIPLDKPHLLLMSTQDPIYPFMP